jgi:phosphate transport system permease protein
MSTAAMNSSNTASAERAAEHHAATQAISQNPIYTKRKRLSKIMMVLAMMAVAFGLFWLVWILGMLIVRGAAQFGPALFTNMTPPPGAAGGGLANAIFGSAMMAFVGTAIGTPIGLMAGVYLAEYAKESKFAEVTRFLNDILLSAPSIVIGLFVYTVYVAKIGHFSGWAGSLALALIVIPIVVRTTDDSLRLVPSALREAVVALGCPQWKMITLVTLKAARSGVITGITLAVARIAGETAPLLFTALNNQFWSTNMNGPMANLPTVIFQFAMSPYEQWQKLAWAGALLITLTVLVLNIIAKSLSSRNQ